MKVLTSKLIQTLGYIQRSSASSNYMKLIKLLYFADRDHLRLYGRTVSKAKYYGMEHGPVAYQSYQVVQGKIPDYIEYEGLERREILSFVQGNIRNIGPYEIEILLKNEDLLTGTDLESLDWAVEKFGQFDQFRLAEIAHDYPEWKNCIVVTRLRYGREPENMSWHDWFRNPKIAESQYIQSHLGGIDPFLEHPPELVEQNRRIFMNEEETEGDRIVEFMSQLST